MCETIFIPKFFAMEQNDKQISAQASLALIESMINKAQNRFSENGTLYLLWGWIVFFCSLGHYMMLQYTNIGNKSGLIWMATWVAVIYQFFYLSKHKKSETVKTYTDEIINYVWVTFGICMALVSFIMAKLGTWAMLYSFILLFYGIPTFLSGIIMRFNPLKIGGITCWLISVTSVYIQSKEIILLLIPAVLSAWIIPGYLLRKKFKSAHI